MKKADMIREILDCSLYEGHYGFKELMKLTKTEIEEIYMNMEDAVFEYEETNFYM